MICPVLLFLRSSVFPCKSAAVDAVGMWKSGALGVGRISKRGGKSGKVRLLTFPRFPRRVISTAWRALFFCDRQRLALRRVVGDPVGTVDDRHSPVQVLTDGHPATASVPRQGVRSICHTRFSSLTVLSLATTRSVCIVKIQFRSLRLVRRNAVPFSSAATLNFALNSPMYRSRRNALASSTVVIQIGRAHV